MILRNISKFIVCFIALNCFNFAGAYTPSYYTSNSKLNSGNWVKVKVTEIGMQEITYDQLREWGFSDPSKVCVYGYGGSQLTKNTFSANLPDDLPAQPVYYGDDKIIFYGEPDYKINLGSDEKKIEVLRNMYSSAGYYFLSDYSNTTTPIPSAIGYNLSNILSREYHNNILYIENEVENPGMAGTYFFDKNLLNGPQTYKFNLIDPYSSDADAIFKYNYGAKVPAYTALNVDFDYPASLITKTKNNQVIPSSLESQYFYTSDGEITFKTNDTTARELSFTISFPSDKTATYAAVDNAYIIYRRQNNLDNNAQLRMSFAGINANTNFILSNGNENVQVWNVTNPFNIYPHSTKYYESSKRLIGTFDKSYIFANTGQACLVAFDPTKEMHKVEFAGKVENQNLHNISTPNMVIITNNLCEPYAEKVAQAHRDYQNLSVLVVNQEKIFNEFSSGTPSAMGYRRFLKMLYDRNKNKLKYLLLFGEGSWDNRGVIFPKDDRLLTYQAEIVEDARSAAKAFCGDSYFGMLNDEYVPEYFYNTEVVLGIGRIPAQSEVNAQAATNKIINYLQNPPTQPVFNRAVILADEGDAYGHAMQQEENIDSILSISPATTCTRAFLTFYPSTDNDAHEARDLVTQALNKGQILFSFAGHGAETSFAAPKNLWSAKDIKEKSYSYPPFAMFATCDAFSFDRKDGGMAEQSLYKEDGGFIAVVAASRTVYMQFNQYINRAFTCELFNATNNDLIGDVFRKARNRASTTISDRTLGVNTMCYNLAGDPALPLYKPSLKVNTTSINDATIDKESTTYPSISPLSKNIIKGNIVDNNGNIQKSFNGTITLSIYDGPSIISAYTKKSGNTSTAVIEYNDSTIKAPVKSYYKSDSLAIVFDETQMAEISTTVTNGQFEISLVTPIAQKPNSINRISYFAISNDKSARASGYLNYVTMSDYNAETAIDDTTAPIIENCYINDISFANGDIVGSDFTFFASISADETGINTANNIGAMATLSLDGKKSFPFANSAITINADGSASLEYIINDIEDGHHTLTLSVKDNTGNSSSKTISFVVVNRSASATLNIAETPARKEATFSLDHNFMDEPMGRIIIEDANGNCIFTKNNCSFPYTWDLKDTNGKVVNDGNYKAYVILKGGNLYGSSDKIDVIVVK